MTDHRMPLPEEPISGSETVQVYDLYARRFLMPEYRYLVRKILQRGVSRGRVLDIGTGSALLAIELARTRGCDFEITGLDISEQMLQKGQHNIDRARLQDRIRLVHAAAADLPFTDGSFDLVISYASLHHWKQPVKVFQEIQRVSRKNGTVLIRDNRRIFGNPFLEALVRLIACLMAPSQKGLWPRSIRASYTIPEVREILRQSGIQGYQVSSDYVKLDLCIARGPLR